MDAIIAEAARALAEGDALGALKRIALRDDAPALALRGIAMAQLGEHSRARELLKRAMRAFGPQEKLARARCVLAEAEVALALRELDGPPGRLIDAATTLQDLGDNANALHARLLAARHFLLLGRLVEARGVLDGITDVPASPMLAAFAGLVRGELALRSLRSADAKAALALADQAAYRTGIPALIAELAEARAVLDRPAARRMVDGQLCTVKIGEVEALLAGSGLVIDACRRTLTGQGQWLALARRPILFALLRKLGQAWPNDVERDALIAAAFRIRRPDESHRARLRVEIGRLRALVKGLASITATQGGFALCPEGAGEVVVLDPPIDGEQAAVLALLSDGAAWSTSALALALGASQRTVQRAMAELEGTGQIHAVGEARSRRWLAPPLVQFATILLLPASLPGT